MLLAVALDLLLTDYSGLPPAVSAAARETAARVFSDAGTELRWRTPNGTSATPGAIRVNLLSGPAADGFFESGAGECGRSAAEGRTVWISVDCAQRIAGRPDALGRVLGALIAHEVTHVVRGDHSHDKSGIMRAHWGKRDLEAIRSGTARIEP